MLFRLPRLFAASADLDFVRTVKLVIGFIGTRYEGWQSQKKGKTLQEIFERNLTQILKEKISIVSSSRTDSGVHAHGLVAHFKTQSRLPDPKIKRALNFYLPKDVLVYSARTVDKTFHARFQAKSKVYFYNIWTGPTRPLFEAPYVLWHPQALDVRLMRRAARFLKGRHDFCAFQDRGDDRKNTRRMVKRIVVKKKKELIRIEIEADGFLRHMVRIVAGTLIEAGRKKMRPNSVLKILKSKDRGNAGPTAKALGLILAKVRY